MGAGPGGERGGGRPGGREAAARPRCGTRGRPRPFPAAPSPRLPRPEGCRGAAAGGGGTGTRGGLWRGRGAARGRSGSAPAGAVSVCSRRAPAAGRRRTSATRSGSRSSCGWWAPGRWGRPGHTGTGREDLPPLPAREAARPFLFATQRTLPVRRLAAGRRALPGLRQHWKAISLWDSPLRRIWVSQPQLLRQ